jgi:hypothetical protein
MPDNTPTSTPIPVYRKDGQIHNFHSIQPAYVHSEGEDPRPFDLRDFEDLSGGRRPIPRHAVGQQPDSEEEPRKISCLEAMATDLNEREELEKSYPQDPSYAEDLQALSDQLKARLVTASDTKAEIACVFAKEEE